MVSRRIRPHGGDAVREPWRPIDHDVYEVPLALEREGPVRVLSLEPRAISKLYSQPMAFELPDALINMLEVLRVKSEPWGELEVDCAKLSSHSQRLDRFPKAGPNLGTDLPRHVLVVDVLLVDGPEGLADILRQRRGRG